ncbi:MAG: hypothetical protein WD648_10390 [Planctomycetaceae bacterium]
MSFNQWIDRYLRRLAFGRFLQKAAEWMGGFLFAFGTLVLLVKLMIPAWWPHVLWVGAAAAPVALVAWLQSRAQCHSRRESAALLDKKLDAGGLLMTLSEMPDDRWADRLPQLDRVWRESLPKLRPVRVARYLALPLVFAVAAGFVPLRKDVAERVLRNTVGRQTATQLEEAIKLLDEAKILEEEEKRELQELVERLQEETRTSPLTHEKWETVDALREKLQLRLEMADATMSKGEAAVAALAKAGEHQQPLSPERAAQLEKAVLDALKKLPPGALSKSAAQAGKDLERLLKNGRFDPSQSPADRQKMLEELKELLKKECDKLSQCRGKCAKCLGGLCEGNGFNNQKGEKADGKPGRGGVNEGRGDAEMSYGDKADDKNTKFKDVVLPPGFFDEPKNDIIATTPQAPDVDPAADAPRSARRLSDPAAGKETWNRKLRPRHRGVVRGYFDSGNNEQPSIPAK